MFKILYRFIYIIISILIVLIIYLSFVGIKTSVFNNLIEKKILEIDQRLIVNLEQVYLKVNLKKIKIKLQTRDPKIFFVKTPIYFEEINLNFDPFKLFNEKKRFDILVLKSKENKIENLLSIINRYQFNLPIALIQKRINNGFLTFQTEIVFDDEINEYKQLQSEGKISKVDIKLLNNNNIKNLNFNFKVLNNEIIIQDSNFTFNKINFNSEKIKIAKNNNTYDIEGQITNSNQNINIKIIEKFLNLDRINLKNENLNIQSDNKFKFIINNKFKIINPNFSSSLKIDTLNFKLNNTKLIDYFPNSDGNVNIKELNLNINYFKNNLDISGNSKYSLENNKQDNLNFSYKKIKNKQIVSSEIYLDNLLFNINKLNFSKRKNESAKISIISEFNNEKINIKSFSFLNKQNKILINDLVLNGSNYKIKNIKKLYVKLLNNKKIYNNFTLLNNKQKFILKGESLDFSQILDDILKDAKNSNFSNLFVNLDTKIKVQISDVYLDELNLLKNLTGEVKIKNNLTTFAEINSFDDKEGNFKLTINVIDDEKVTTIFADNAEPFVKKFKFIKGFKNGKLDFYSTKKNNLSQSSVKIFNFKLKEVPVLTKILSLASLQGIADLMTGEGIRFDDFEMNFTNNNDVIKIDEIYAIGPAISILMNGYVEKNKLVSLRGTLVPATTVNKTIGSIPILGDILIGKKTGEGVFGVSFKIKGPPEDLKTSVNPIKTLTPRFITRTLEKIKKN